jgi:hypothetical protein
MFATRKGVKVIKKFAITRFLHTIIVENQKEATNIMIIAKDKITENFYAIDEFGL